MKNKKPIIHDDEEIVEMKEGGDGKYHPIAVVKVSEIGRDKPTQYHDAQRNGAHLPRWFPVAYELIDGFAIGLGAIENFMYNVKRMNRRSQKRNEENRDS